MTTAPKPRKKSAIRILPSYRYSETEQSSASSAPDPKTGPNAILIMPSGNGGPQTKDRGSPSSKSALVNAP